MSKIIILIPSYNEYYSLKYILNKIHNKFSILVMNDCSTDKTYLLKKKFKKIFMINNKKRLGYEKNILKGFKIIMKKKFDYVITFDADGEHDVKSLNKINYFLKKNTNVDLLIGKRSFFNRFSEKIISLLFNFRFGIQDPLSGLKAYKTIELKKIITFIKHDYFLTDIIYIFNKHKKKIKNIDIQSIKVKQRKSKIGSFYANLKILRSINFFLKP